MQGLPRAGPGEARSVSVRRLWRRGAWGTGVGMCLWRHAEAREECGNALREKRTEVSGGAAGDRGEICGAGGVMEIRGHLHEIYDGLPTVAPLEHLRR